MAADTFIAFVGVYDTAADADADYELVKAPLRRPKREEVIRLSGQEMVPIIELEDGTVVREQGKVLAEMIRSGSLFEGHGPTS